MNAFDGDVVVDVNLNLDGYVRATLSIEDSCDEGFHGDASLDVGFSLNAAADGDFFDLFDKTVSITLFQDDWTLWSVSHRVPDVVGNATVSLILFPRYRNRGATAAARTLARSPLLL